MMLSLLGQFCSRRQQKCTQKVHCLAHLGKPPFLFLARDQPIIIICFSQGENHFDEPGGRARSLLKSFLLDSCRQQSFELVENVRNLMSTKKIFLPGNGSCFYKLHWIATMELLSPISPIELGDNDKSELSHIKKLPLFRTPYFLSKCQPERIRKWTLIWTLNNEKQTKKEG